MQLLWVCRAWAQQMPELGDNGDKFIVILRATKRSLRSRQGDGQYDRSTERAHDAMRRKGSGAGRTVEVTATPRETMAVTGETALAVSAPAQPGVVVEVSSSMCHVDLGRQSLAYRLRGSLGAAETGYTNVVAVGDRVVISVDSLGQGVVEAVMPRWTILKGPTCSTVTCINKV